MSLVNLNINSIIRDIMLMECGGMLSASVILISLKKNLFKISNIDIPLSILLGVVAFVIAMSI